jgi:hypothetical protein
MEPNTRVKINGEVIYALERGDKNIVGELFQVLLNSAEEFVMNDDGGRYKQQMSRYLIAMDDTGRFWHFKVEENSEELLKKIFEYYLNKEEGDWFWSLEGEDFVVRYQECGDEEL